MIYTAFIFGLISSLHCIGMCGAIAMMLPVNHNNPAQKTLQLLLYHLGRLSAYGLMGLVFGILGKGLYLAGIQQQLSIIMGILMIIITLVPEKVFAKYNFSRPVYKAIAFVKSSLGKQFKSKTLQSFYTIGLLNGFLPCGLVYAALFGALAMQNITLSTLYMVLYGLGTVPMMSAVVYISNLLSMPIRSKLQKIIPAVVVGIGILFIIRGLGLDIPYLSPSNINLFVTPNANCH